MDKHDRVWNVTPNANPARKPAPARAAQTIGPVERDPSINRWVCLVCIALVIASLAGAAAFIVSSLLQ